MCVCVCECVYVCERKRIIVYQMRLYTYILMALCMPYINNYLKAILMLFLIMARLFVRPNSNLNTMGHVTIYF